jgi:hypothetical protein
MQFITRKNEKRIMQKVGIFILFIYYFILLLISLQQKNKCLFQMKKEVDSKRKDEFKAVVERADNKQRDFISIPFLFAYIRP